MEGKGCLLGDTYDFALPRKQDQIVDRHLRRCRWSSVKVVYDRRVMCEDGNLHAWMALPMLCRLGIRAGGGPFLSEGLFPRPLRDSLAEGKCA